jgi:hypothetical protein
VPEEKSVWFENHFFQLRPSTSLILLPRAANIARKSNWIPLVREKYERRTGYCLLPLSEEIFVYIFLLRLIS